MRHPDPEGPPPSGGPPDTGGPLAGCFPHLGRPCGGQCRRMNCPSGAIPRPVHWALHPLRPNDKNGTRWSGPVPVPALYRNPAHCGVLVARSPSLSAPGGPPSRQRPPVRGSGNIGPSGRPWRCPPGSAGRPLPGRALGRLVALPLLRAPSRPGRSGSPPPPAPARLWPGGLCRGRRAWPAEAGGRPWCGCAARGSGAGPVALVSVATGGRAVGPGA